MKVDATIQDATLRHAMQLGDNLRPEDRAELEAIGATDPHRALVNYLKGSGVAFAAVLNGEVGAMFGTAPVDSALSAPEGLAAVWMLTGRKFAEKPRAFIRPARGMLQLLLERHHILVNYIDARYEAAVRWAKWLGFVVGSPVPYGPAGMPFHLARLEAH